MRLNVLTWNILADTYLNIIPSKHAAQVSLTDPLLSEVGPLLLPIEDPTTDGIISDLQALLMTDTFHSPSPASISSTTICPPTLPSSTISPSSSISATTIYSDWMYRSHLIQQCLDSCLTSTDIFCLQEVDRYEDFYQEYFNSRGFESIYYQRPKKTDGCLIAFNRTSFALINQHRISFDDDVRVHIEHQNLKKYLKHNVALVVTLRCLTSSKIFMVINTHIHWNPNLPEVKIAQILCILQYIRDRKNDNAIALMDGGATTTAMDGATLPVVLTGDFNVSPHDEIYRLLTSTYSTSSSPSSSSSSSSSSSNSNSDNIALLASHYKTRIYGDAFRGPKTRFLSDPSLIKLCKQMRVLGINVAMDSWDGGMAYSKTTKKGNVMMMMQDQAAATASSSSTGAESE